MASFALGQRCRFPAYGPAIQITDNGALFLWPAPRMSRTEAAELQHGQLQFGFKEDGKLLHFGARSKYLGTGGIVSFNAPLVPLPEDDQGVSYICSLVGVDTETQKVKAMRMFAFSREIGDLLWRMSQVWSEAWLKSHHAEVRRNLPTEQELFRPPSITWTLKKRA